jgi:hypothetical protein
LPPLTPSNNFSSVAPHPGRLAPPPFQHPMSRSGDTINNHSYPPIPAPNLGGDANAMASPTSADASYMPLAISAGSHQGQYRFMSPGSGPSQNTCDYMTDPPFQHLLPTSQHSLPSSTLPRIPGKGNGQLSRHKPWFSRHNTPFPVLTAGALLFLSPATHLGVPSLPITNHLHEHQTPELEICPISPGCGAGTVSDSMPAVPSLIGGGTTSAPGTASNGGSVPLTPTTDDATPFGYHPFTSTAAGGSDHVLSHTELSGSIGYADGANEGEENDEEDEGGEETIALSHHGGAGGPNGSPRRGVGVIRTPKNRRSAAVAAGPRAAAAFLNHPCKILDG